MKTKFAISGIVLALGVSSCNLHMREAREESRKARHEKVEEKAVDESDGTTVKKEENPTTYNSANASALMNKYAVQLKVNPDKLYNEQLYAAIDGWIGVKYKWGGNDKNGVDCSGFACAIYKTVYEFQLKRSGYDIAKDCKEVSKADLMEGDLVFFDISSKNSHVGIYLANGKFVHASSSKGVMISDLNETYWVKYWGRGARIP